MSDYCWECSDELFAQGFANDLKGLCKEGERVEVLCEGCGWILVDHNGVRIDEQQATQELKEEKGGSAQYGANRSATRAASPQGKLDEPYAAFDDLEVPFPKFNIDKSLSWSAVVINLVGAVLCSNEAVLCWPLFILANIILFVYFIRKKDFALTFLNTCYFAINAYAWWKWGL